MRRQTVHPAALDEGMLLRTQEVLRILQETGVVRKGHFRLTSGMHTDLFLLCSLVQQFPHHTESLARAMAAPFRSRGVQVVAGTAVGGIILAYEVARALEARAIFADKSAAGEMVLRRGFPLSAGERTLIVEDAVSTGGSVRKVMEAIAARGGEVIGVSALVDRSGGRVQLGVPIRALITMDAAMWDPADCPLCRDGVPLVHPKDLGTG